MRKLTVTLCLTIAVLLGSTGVSWGADSKKLARDFLYEKGWVLGVNYAGKKNEFFVVIGSGNTLLETFCNAVSVTVKVLQQLKRGNRTRENSLSTAEMRNEWMFRSKFKLKVNKVSRTSESIDAKNMMTLTKMMRSSISIKSPNGHLTCDIRQRWTNSGEKYQQHLEFMGNSVDFASVFAEFQAGGRLVTFMNQKERKAPEFSIVFASSTKNWRQ